MQDVEALRALAFERLAEGDVKAAYQLISQVIARGCPTLDDIYLGGQWALDSGNYTEAVQLLSSVIHESITTGDFWYLDCAYIARAYARALLGQYNLAKEDLESANDTAEVFWMRSHPVINKALIVKLISQKSLLQ